MKTKNGFIRKFKNVTFNFDFVMIYIIHKILVLLKTNLNYFKDGIFKCYFKEYNRLLYLWNKYDDFFLFFMEKELEKQSKVIKNKNT